MENIVQGQWFRGPSADLGAPIDQSLRFRGAQKLEFTPSEIGNRDIHTISVWVKRGSLTSKTPILEAYNTSTSNTYLSWTDSTDQIQYRRETGSGVSANNSTDAQFRDPSAWYHVVFVYNSTESTSADRTKFYVNGALQTHNANNNPSLNENSTFTSNLVHRIGRSQEASAWSEYYLAEYFLIDGQALDPTDFGKYNEDGVWVPQNYTGTYGTNGFHLTFDSSQTNGIGHDSSGNGNHFTATGFDTADVRQYSSGLFTVSDDPSQSNAYLTATGTAWTAGTPANFFDGAGTEVRATQNAVLRFDPAIPNVTQIQTVTERLGTTNWFNGTSQTSSSVDNSFNTIYTGSAINLTSIVFSSDASLATNYKQIRVTTNGTQVELIDNTDNDVDYNDTPTSNYATFNAILSPTNQTLSNANLTGAGGSTQTSLTTQLPDYKYYWEGVGSNYYYGISEIDAVRDDYLGSKDNQVGWYLDGSFWVNGVNVGTFGPSFSTTDIAMQAYDPATGNYWVGINGTWHGSGDPENGTNPAYTVGASIRENMVPANNVVSGTASYNFGQMNFIHTKPTGFEALQTNNLPEPTIKNGKEHFGAITYTGTGVDSHAITGLDFQPDLVWIKPRSVGDNHRLMDSVRGVLTHLIPNSSSGEPASNAQVLESFDSGGFTLDGTDAGWNGNTSTYVAWCWKGGGTAVSNTQGNKTVTLSANPTGGFSIAEVPGDSSTALTYGHGLGKAPEFIIRKATNTTGGWYVWHKDLPSSDGFLRLDTTDSHSTTSIINGTQPTDTLVAFTAGNAQNEDGNTLITYNFTGIEGFSKFGSYTGNGSADGAFVYLGFKPAFILLKSPTSALDWQLYDSTRSPNNPATLSLSPNLTTTEVTSGNDLDILANGFKCRDNGSINNGSGITYLYMAFAESPFGGTNQPPATAR